jgi:hypothetical protein
VEVAVGLGADQRRGQHALDELLQPAARVDPVVGFRPDAELLDVVEIHGGALALAGQLFQVGDGLCGGRERQAVAQLLGDREEVDVAAVLLGGVETVELVGLLAGAEEVVVVHRHVFHAAVGQRRHHGRDVHPLGQPGALDAGAEARSSLPLRRRSGRCGRAAGSPPAPARSRRRRTARPGRARPSP